MLQTLVGQGDAQMLGGILDILETTKSYLLVFIGFSLVIFVHELGHFTAAKLCNVKIDRFAVGFLTTLFSYRRGLGFRWGSSEKEYRQRLLDAVEKGRAGEMQSTEKLEPTDEELERAGQTLRLGETEYCFNALPLGGYVKMLGQEDFAIDKSGELAVKEHPRAFTHKPVGQRMIIVSAGVVMNLVFASFLFMLVFMFGMDVPSAELGAVMPNTPADRAGLRPGDVITHINGREIADRQDLVMAVSLAHPDELASINFKRKDPVTGDWKAMSCEARPEKMPGEDQLKLGVGEPSTTEIQVSVPDPALLPEEQLMAGDVIIAAGDEPVTSFDRVECLAANAAGEWIDLTVRRPVKDSPTKEFKEVHVRRRSRLVFKPTGQADQTDGGLMGLVPRRLWNEILDPSGKPATALRRGDVVVRWGGILAPRWSEIEKSIRDNSGKDIQVCVLREHKEGNQTVQKEELITVRPQARSRFGTTIEPLLSALFWVQEVGPPVVADILPDVTNDLKSATAALKDKMPRGSRLTKINDQPVDSWPQVLRKFVELAGQDVKLSWVYEQTPEQSATIHVPQTLDTALNLPFASIITSINGKSRVEGEYNGRREAYEANSAPGQYLLLKDLVGQTVNVEYAMLLDTATKTAQVKVLPEMVDSWKRRITFQAIDVRPKPKLVLLQERNPVKAMLIGIRKTYFFIESIIVMMDRMVLTRSVSMDQVAGPVGIVRIGGGMAGLGMIYLLYFLALISANLAVINFMPLPIMDGGLFVFLLIEKIKGKPISLRVQVATQLIGLVLIVGIFLIVTVKDIVNW